MDDTTTQTQNPVIAEDSNQYASSASETNTSGEQLVEPVAQETASAETTSVEPVAEVVQEVQPEHQPRPAERRINELVQQNKQLREQLSTLPTPAQSPQAPKLSDLVAGKENIMPDELDKLGEQVWQQGAQTGRGLSSLEVAQLRQELAIKDAINETDSTAKILPSEYDELNPKSTSYNPALERKIVDLYQARAVRNDPTTGKPVLDTSIKLADVARDEVDYYRTVAESGKAQVANTLASQADETAITPTSSAPVPDKTFDQMSLAEQETFLRAQGHDI